ncbi:hypothetical protein IAU60_006709 [Kwoniella sp. DSM 27419]
MSDSEDDFMSDKFLVEPAPKKEAKSYTARRHEESLKSLRKGQAKNQVPLRVLEEARRREGLNRSLFDLPSAGPSTSTNKAGSSSASDSRDASSTAHAPASGGNKAMDLMMKMGWKVGEGLGKKRSPSPPGASAAEVSKRAKVAAGLDGEAEDDTPRREGIGSSTAASASRGRAEPIRISMWAGRKGLSAREPSPPPLPTHTSGRDPDRLDPKKLERLGKETEGFRERQRAEYKEKELVRKGRAAREKLKELDLQAGIVFHPLHVFPPDPLGTLPRPLLRLVYPAQAFSPSPSPGPETRPEPIQAFEREQNVSAAEKLRAQMRRDMLSELGTEDDDEPGVMRFGVLENDEREARKAVATKPSEELTTEEAKLDWEEHVSGTKRVLSMDAATYLAFEVDQLRNEHLFCFWCAYKYRSFEEMDGPGGCPGQDEDDH